MGYSHDDNTWENIENLFCDDLVKEFEENRENKNKSNKQISKKIPNKTSNTLNVTQKNNRNDEDMTSNATCTEKNSPNNILLKTKNKICYKIEKVIIDKNSGKYILSKNRVINNEFDGIIERVIGIRKINDIEFIVLARFKDGSKNLFSLENAYNLFPLHLLKYYEKCFLLNEPEETSFESENDSSSDDLDQQNES